MTTKGTRNSAAPPDPPDPPSGRPPRKATGLTTAHRWAAGVAVTVLVYITLLTLTAGAKPTPCCH